MLKKNTFLFAALILLAATLCGCRRAPSDNDWLLASLPPRWKSLPAEQARELAAQAGLSSDDGRTAAFRHEDFGLCVAARIRAAPEGISDTNDMADALAREFESAEEPPFFMQVIGQAAYIVRKDLGGLRELDGVPYTASVFHAAAGGFMLEAVVAVPDGFVDALNSYYESNRVAEAANQMYQIIGSIELPPRQDE